MILKHQIKPQVYNSLDEICRTAVNIILENLEANALSIIVPGGNTPRFLFNLLAKVDIDWSASCLILSDERMVPLDHRDSNYGMINELLLKKLSAKSKPMIIPDMKKFNKMQKNDFLNLTNSLLKEKLPIKHAFLGIGADGHTASLFPENVNDSIINGPFYYTKKQGDLYKRMTLSMEVLKSIPDITFLVSGKSKHTPLKAIINGDKKNDKSPVHQLINEAQGQVSILCDQKAWPVKVNA